MYIQYVLVVSIIPKCILHPKFKQITHIYVYIYITYIYPTYIYMYICIINMRVNVEGLSTGNNKKILWTSTLFFKTGGFSSPRDRPRREVPWAWWCQTLVSSKSSPPTKPNPRGDDPRKVWLPRPLSQVETWWMNFSQMWMSNIASKTLRSFFLKQRWSFSKNTGMWCAEQNRNSWLRTLNTPVLWMVPFQKSTYWWLKTRHHHLIIR